MEEIKRILKNKLACIDIANKNSNGEERAMKFLNELYGMKIALRALGIKLELDINPYYYNDNYPSTYKLSIEE